MENEIILFENQKYLFRKHILIYVLDNNIFGNYILQIKYMITCKRK